MGQEIERKFLVADDSWRAAADAGARYRQGYLHSDPSLAVRVRTEDGRAVLTIKGGGEGIVRSEYEYEIPRSDAEEMLEQLCRAPLIDKTRYHVRHQGHLWEIDVFAGANAGLVVAEIELDAEHEVFARPGWLGLEVSDDPRYYNARLAQHPYCEWDDNARP